MTLQLAPRAGSNPTFDLHRIQHVTATVHTLNSTYVVVARKGFVAMTLASTLREPFAWAPQVGETYTGEVLMHSDNGLVLIGSDGEPVLRTSPVVTIDVHEN